MTLKIPRRHSVWLCPSPDVAAQLRREIDAFATRSGTDPFEPHVTLLGDLACAPQATLDAGTMFFDDIGAIGAEVSGLTRTSAFFISLFLDVQLDPRVFSCRSAMRSQLGLVADPSFRPHLSLAYGLAPDALTQAEKRVLQEKFSGVAFHLTTLAIVTSGKDVPISDWRILAELPLPRT